MSSTSPNPQAHNARSAAEQQLRDSLRADLVEFLAASVYTSGYVVSWISHRMPLDQLEALVDELDGTFTVNGRSILTGELRKK